MSREWAELAYHITEKIKEHESCIKAIEEKQTEFKVDLAVMKVKAALISAGVPMLMGFLGWVGLTIIKHLTEG